jgi:hypothetical protein
VRSPRETCELKDRCGQTGHVFENGYWRRCPCLELEMAQTKLRELYTEHPNHNSPLKKKLDKDLLIQGPLQTVRKHTAGALMSTKGRYLVLEGFRMLDIFLEKDEEYETSRPTVDVDLLVLLLGFGDPRNKYLPELLLQALSRRALTQKPTWVVTALTPDQIAHKYTQELAAILRTYEQVNAK